MTPLADKELESYDSQENCYICKEKLKEENAFDEKYCKVRDHCHYTGKYRGGPHNICNLRYSIIEEIPGIFHSR